MIQTRNLTAILLSVAAFVLCLNAQALERFDQPFDNEDLHEPTWYISLDGAGAGDGSSWENAQSWSDFITTELLDDADPKFREYVYFKSGTYQWPDGGEVVIENQRFWLGGFPDSVSSPTLQERNPVDSPTIFLGPAAVQNDRFIRLLGSGCIIDGFVFDGFKNDLEGWDDVADRGVVFTKHSDNIISNCVFQNNQAVETGVNAAGNLDFNPYDPDQPGGAAIHVFLDTENNLIYNCDFIDNSLTGGAGSGGAICLGRKVSESTGPEVTIENCRFFNNTSENNGGAIGGATANLNIINCVFANNTAENDGAAIYHDYLKGHVVNSSFFANTLTTTTTTLDEGVAISIQNGADTRLNIVNNIFKANSTGTSGSAIQVDAATSVTVQVANNLYQDENATHTGPGITGDLGGHVELLADSTTQIFVDPSDPTFDFQLIDLSAPVNEGLLSFGTPNIVPPLDYLGNSVKGGARDMGAYENQFSPNSARHWSLF